MAKKKRVAIPTPLQRKVKAKNLGVCCVCKERGIGIHLHHLDEDPSNNVEDNLVVLCVKEHDQHHRPGAYTTVKHIELGKEKLKGFKEQWENTVNECKKENPQILAVINVYGTIESIHSVRLLVQNIEGKIIYERLYHLLTGSPEQWVDSILEEVIWLGKNVKLTVVDEPLQIEYCPCCNTSLPNIIDKNSAIHLTAGDWKEKSIATIYINPEEPSLALTVFYGDELLYKAHLHKCNKRSFHFLTEKFEERTPIKKFPSIRTQATEIVQKVIKSWEPGNIFIGTGDPEKPNIIGSFDLPKIWEKR